MNVMKASAAVLGLSLLAGTALANCSFADGTSSMIRTQPLLGAI